MKHANYAPVYCALYPELAEVAREHGYALSIHGSLARDFDLVCLPWGETVLEPQAVVNAMVDRLAIHQVGGHTHKNHGRIAYTLSIVHGECAIDLSFFPASLARSAFIERAFAANDGSMSGGSASIDAEGGAA